MAAAADPTTASTLVYEYRVDRGELLSSRQRPDGTLLVEGWAAREGVLEYRTPQGIVRELVTAETLQASAAGLGRAPVTLGHPDPNRYPSGVTPDNIAELGVGDTDGEVQVEEGGFVRVRLAIRRRDATNAVAAGVRELSPGYSVGLDRTPGNHPVHGRYDAIQVSRTYNHLALVDRARGGAELQIRADSGVAIHSITAGKAKRGHMNSKFVTLLAMLGILQRVDSDDAAIDAVVDKLKERRDAADKADRAQAEALAAAVAERDTLRARVDVAERDRDAQRARADAAESERDTLRANDAKRRDAAERESLEQIAAALHVDATKHATLGELKRAVARAHLGADLRADASDAYVDAMVDLAIQGQKAQGRQAGAQAWSQSEARADARANEPDHEAASWKRWSGPAAHNNSN